MVNIGMVRASEGWKFWLKWGAAFVGFPLGGLAAQAATGAVTTPAEGVLAGVATGAVIGAAQWLVLRQRLPLSAWWIAATASGMAAGLSLSIATLGISTSGNALPLRGLITGAGIGIAQYLLLRPLTEHAAWWIAIVTGSWALGWTITRAVGVDLTANWSVFGSTGAWAFQFVTGVALAWLMGKRTAE